MLWEWSFLPYLQMNVDKNFDLPIEIKKGMMFVVINRVEQSISSANEELTGFAFVSTK